MAIRFLFVAAVLAAVVLTPIQMHYDKDGTLTSWELPEPGTILNTTNPKKPLEPPPGQGYLWTNVIFIYAFTILAFYFLRNQTQELIKHRQQYLGNQNSVTDRTIRLSGIPPELRNEEKLKKNLEDLQIGKVKDITICRNWRKLDSLVEERQAVLRKLEEAHTVQGLLFGIGLPVSSETADEEARPLLQSDGDDSSPRGPLLTVRHGWLNLRKRRVSAIDYFAKKLEDLDYKIQEARKDAYEATPLAFVTMDSVQSAVWITTIFMRLAAANRYTASYDASPPGSDSWLPYRASCPTTCRCPLGEYISISPITCDTDVADQHLHNDTVNHLAYPCCYACWTAKPR